VKRIAAAVLGLGLSCASLLADPSVKQRIVGTWRLVSVENRDSADQPWEKKFGDSPKGLIIYDAAGHMAVQFEKMPPPPKFASGDDWTPTPEEARGAYLGYLAYFGTYTVDEATETITHHVQGSLRPSYLGTDQVRPATFEGNRLILSDGKKFRVVWERAE
jgi:hypothetical protein